MIKTLDSLNPKGKRVLLRVDFNVPLSNEFEITDHTRLKAAEPTINKLLNEGAAVVLMSHMGRPKGEAQDKFSLRHIVTELSRMFNREVKFAADCVSEESFELSRSLKPGEILLLENLRFHAEEKAGDKGFAEKLASHGDIYVNDAFGTAHRAHASTSVIAQFFEEKTMGFVMENELTNAQRVLSEPQRPFTAIMGGAKISDKIMIIEQLLDKVDNLLIGGGMAYTFFKAKGGNIGNSLCEEEKLDLALSLLKKAEEKGVKLILPEDSVTADAFSNEAKTLTADNMNIPDGFMGLDIGVKASERFSDVIKSSKTVLWNGPMGVFEMSSFAEGTRQAAHAVVEATENGAFSLIGGGDSAAAVNSLGFGDRVSYVSTGGGALLKFMEGKTLPGLSALEV